MSDRLVIILEEAVALALVRILVAVNAPVSKVMVGLVQESHNFLPVFAETFLFVQVSEFCQVCHQNHFWKTF